MYSTVQYVQYSTYSTYRSLSAGVHVLALPHQVVHGALQHLERNKKKQKREERRKKRKRRKKKKEKTMEKDKIMRVRIRRILLRKRIPVHCYDHNSTVQCSIVQYSTVQYSTCLLPSVPFIQIQSPAKK
jgi:heme exporter protein D